MEEFQCSDALFSKGSHDSDENNLRNVGVGHCGTGHSVRRLKLSIILYDTATLVFVDRIGNKVMEKHATDFLHELEKNQSRIIMDESICHHALNTVIGMLAKH